MRPTEIEADKVTNKLNALIKFFMKDMQGKRYDENGVNLSVVAIKKALDHAERIGWIKGDSNDV